MASFAWSYSALNSYETCAKRYYHYSVAKDVKEVESAQASDGNQTHQAFDAYLKSRVQLPLGAGHWKPMLDRILAAPGQTYSERKLALSSNLTPVAWFSPNTWFRGVLDCTKINGAAATVLDWKTGRPSFDRTQLSLQAALVFASASSVEVVKAGLVFVNHDRVEKETYRKSDVSGIWNMVLPRVRKMENARQTMEYPPTPGGLCKRYCQVTSCPYHGVGSRP